MAERAVKKSTDLDIEYLASSGEDDIYQQSGIAEKTVTNVVLSPLEL